MAKELKPIDVSQLPELLRIAEQVRASVEACVLKRDHEELAVLSPVNRARTARRRKSGLIAKDDALWDIVGLAGDDKGPTDVSRNKHKYLAEAYATKRP